MRRLLERDDVLINGTENIFAVYGNYNGEIFEILLSSKAIDVNATNQARETALYEAARHNNLSAIETLLDDKRFSNSKDAKDPYGISAVGVALESQSIDAIILMYAYNLRFNDVDLADTVLVEIGSSLDAKSDEEYSLHCLCARAVVCRDSILIKRILPFTTQQHI